MDSLKSQNFYCLPGRAGGFPEMDKVVPHPVLWRFDKSHIGELRLLVLMPTLCAEEVCPLFLGKAERIHWPIRAD